MELFFEVEILRRKEEEVFQELIMMIVITDKVVIMGQILIFIFYNNYEKDVGFMDREIEV